MSLEVTVLGCGNADSLEHFNPSLLVTSAQGRLLIDAGHTVKHALHAQGLSLADIDAIYVTHVHGDHVFGLERFAYEGRFKYHKRPHLLFHHTLHDELWHQTLKGSLSRVGEGESSFDDYFRLEPLEDTRCRVLGVDLELLPLRHTPGKPTWGLLVQQQLLYAVDTCVVPEWVNTLPWRYCIHDCTLADWNPVHATLDAMVDSYPPALRKRMWLTSYEDHWREHLQRVERDFAGFATQGMRFTLDAD